VAGNPKLQVHTARIQAHVVNSEDALLRTAQDPRTRGFVSAAPTPFADPDFAHVPYWLNHPDDDQKRATEELWKSAFGQLPPTQLTPQTYSALVNNFSAVLYVGPDGSIFGGDTYELLDPAAIPMIGEYIWHYFFEDFAPFNTTPAAVALKGSAADSVSIAIIGDWGTGPYTPGGPAGDVADKVKALKPDYVIHLGDVYYSGTASEIQTNLLDGWPGAAGRSFTLNANHEMYNGGHGYFETALTDPIFGAQNGCSYGALTFGRWTILLLDSAYWSTSSLVTNGSICNPTSSRSGKMAQMDFIKSLALDPKNTIVLTHHNPISFDGISIVDDGAGNNLWAQVTTALGAPAAWYWGHIHNGIVYTTPIVGSVSTIGRCLGHAAVPFGHGSGLPPAENPPKHVEWFSDTPNPDHATAPRVLNGFAYLTLTTSGRVTEVLYDQTGKDVFRPTPYQLG
jgi:hypothetical protein